LQGVVACVLEGSIPRVACAFTSQQFSPVLAVSQWRVPHTFPKRPGSCESVARGCGAGQHVSMGRQSREKKRRREDPAYRAHVVALKAEAKGRLVGPTPRAYEDVARREGSDGVIRALISRHNQRWENVRRNVGALSDPVAETLHVLFPLDVALCRLGADFSAHPASPYGEGPDHLRWALDSACQVQRMILACNVMGAAAVARTQLERWSVNRASSNGFMQEDGTGTPDFYTEIWRHETPSVEAGRVWNDASRLLHGRGPLVAAARWDAANLASPARLEHVEGAVQAIETAVQLSLRQALLCVVGLVTPPRFPAGLAETLRYLPLSLPSEVVLQEAAPSLWPLTYDYLRVFGSSLIAGGEAYADDVRKLEGGVPPREVVYSARSFEAFASRRSRAAAWARAAFDAEAAQLGSDFDPDSLRGREFSYILIAEVAGLLGSWMSGPPSDALIVAAASLRAAFWLWLEDDERAMVLVRSILEQSARIRTWRLKPKRAAEVEERGDRVRTRDWLQEAGWRRLSILNRSLGEFSHANSMSRWTGAREALALIQPESRPGKSLPVQTARGSALDSVAFALGSEVFEWAHRDHPALADALAGVLPRDSGAGAPNEVEEWLRRCWSKRGLSFGEADSGTVQP